MGSKTAATLTSYGLHRVADVADLPAATLQRLLGARTGRTLHERALGHDTTIVAPSPTPASISTEHRFPRDELDPVQHRRALLALADDLGTRLRASGQVAAGLTCTIRYADSSATRRGRALPEATQHTVVLARAAYEVYESLGLQRAPGPQHRAARQHSASRRLGDPATHPGRRRREAAGDRSRRRSRPDPLREPGHLPRGPRGRRRQAADTSRARADGQASGRCLSGRASSA